MQFRHEEHVKSRHDKATFLFDCIEAGQAGAHILTASSRRKDRDEPEGRNPLQTEASLVRDLVGADWGNTRPPPAGTTTDDILLKVKEEHLICSPYIHRHLHVRSSNAEQNGIFSRRFSWSPSLWRLNDLDRADSRPGFPQDPPARQESSVVSQLPPSKYR